MSITSMIMYRLQLFAKIQRIPQHSRLVNYYSSVSKLAGIESPTGTAARRTAKFPPRVEKNYPAIFKARNVRRTDLEAFGASFRPILDPILDEHGLVLIRGSEMYSEEDFSRFLNALDYRIMRNIPGLGEARPEVGRNIYGARPAHQIIEPHQELSHLIDYPHLFLVHCQDPTEPLEDHRGGGGELVVVRVKDVQRKLDRNVLEKFDRLGVRYCRRLPCYSDWQPTWRQVMRTMSRITVSQRLTRNGFHHRWDDEGTLHYWIDRPALQKHYKTGEKLWFNQITTQHWTFYSNQAKYNRPKLNLRPEQFPGNTLYGDGTAIENDVIELIRDVTWDNSVCFRLKRGDVVIMDNMLVQHGWLSAWPTSEKRKVSVGLARYA